MFKTTLKLYCTMLKHFTAKLPADHNLHPTIL
jgi:hypothetical protein